MLGERLLTTTTTAAPSSNESSRKKHSEEQELFIKRHGRHRQIILYDIVFSWNVLSLSPAKLIVTTTTIVSLFLSVPAEPIGMASTDAAAANNNPDLFHRRNEGQPYGLRPSVCKYLRHI